MAYIAPRLNVHFAHSRRRQTPAGRRNDRVRRVRLLMERAWAYRRKTHCNVQDRNVQDCNVQDCNVKDCNVKDRNVKDCHE
jgi:hypothetical protein